MLRLVYDTLLYAFAPVALALTAARGLREPPYRDRLAERLGRTRLRFDRAPIWIHAVSVGEVQAAAALVRALQKSAPGLPILVTTATPTGAQRVQALFQAGVSHAYLPYDLPGAVRRFLDAVTPRVAIVMEREIWPNLFDECRRRGIAVVLASARLSERSARRHRRLRGLFGAVLARGVVVAAQTPADAERFQAIGAPPCNVHVTGNVKFDLEIPQELGAAGEALRHAQFPARPVWIAASTHEKEEDIVLEAHRQVCAARPEALLLLVPRHPPRFAQVRAWLKAGKVSFATRSMQERVTSDTAVLLVDTLGELLMFYAAADVAFVGGSLVPIGGHNLLEPAALGRAILVGPHNFNAPEIAELLLGQGAARQVAAAAPLGTAVIELLNDSACASAMGARARAVVEANRGALARLLQLVEPLMKQEQLPPAGR